MRGRRVRRARITAIEKRFEAETQFVIFASSYSAEGGKRQRLNAFIRRNASGEDDSPGKFMAYAQIISFHNNCLTLLRFDRH